MKLWIDLAIIAVLIICVWSGYKKGLIMGIGSIIAIIISIYAANLLSTTFSYEIIPALTPFANGYMEKKMNEEVSETLGIEDSGLSIDDYLEQNPDNAQAFCIESFKAIGIHDVAAEKMATQAEYRAEDQNISVPDAIVEVLCENVAYIGGFVLAFLMVLILITVIGNIPNLSFKIPNMDILNDVGGAIFGLATGVLLCTVLVWTLKFAGLILKDALSETWLASILLDYDPIAKYLGI